MLRLKGERGEHTSDEPDEVEPDEAETDRRESLAAENLTTPEAEDGDRDPLEGDDYWTEEETSPLLRGLGIAAATFVPTFLAVFFGLPYLLGPSTPIHVPANRAATPPAAATAPLDGGTSQEVTASLSETLRRVFSDRPNESPAATPRVANEQASRDLDARLRETSPRESRAQASAEAPQVPAPAPAPAPSALEPAPAAPAPEPSAPPALPPAVSRQRAAPPAPPALAPRPAVARSEPRATPEARKPADRSVEWTPAAAFADRDAAGRLASSIEKQGYPVEVRQDGSSSRPWVVWIGAQPGGARRR